jgi:SAM-dependent methyltransferase
MADNEYETAAPYAEHLIRTNEKQKLYEHVITACEKGEFPLARNSSGNILDVGSGSGINAKFLADYFTHCQVLGIEPSPAQFQTAVNKNRCYNLIFISTGIEYFPLFKKFDFVLVSHVLQYLPERETPEDVVKIVCKLLKSGGVAYIIQQTTKGIAQIIEHMRPFLKNPRFNSWKTFENYEPMIRRIAKECGCTTHVDYLDSSLQSVDFANLTGADELWLRFVLLLKGSVKDESPEFKRHLSLLGTSMNGTGGRISHPNGILKIKKP